MDAQTSTMDAVWIAASKISRDAETGPELLSFPESFIELLVQFFVTLLTERPRDGDLEKTAIAHCSGVLGIHPKELVFRRAYDYTLYLSALIWISRLVMSEYAIPLRPYATLTVPWPDRDAYPDLGQRLCEQIRKKYL